jgi:predicted DNA-binding transcriptional regulator YafY
VAHGSTVRKALLPLARALAEGRRAWLLYDDAGGARIDREVEVLALAWRGGPWLAAAFCHRREAFRLFRVDRVERARVTRKPVRPGRAPPGFDPRFFSTTGFLEPGREGPPVLATVRLRDGLAGLATALFPSALYEWPSDGGVLCHLRATDLWELARLVASLGDGAELCHPQGARERAAAPGEPPA